MRPARRGCATSQTRARLAHGAIVGFCLVQVLTKLAGYLADNYRTGKCAILPGMSFFSVFV